MGASADCRPVCRDAVVDLRVDHGRAVDAKQRLAFFHVRAGLLHVELLDEGVGAQRHRVQRALVGLGDAGRTHGPHEAAHLGALGAHARALHAVEADLDRARHVLRLVGVDGDVVHAHGVLLRHRGGVGEPHGVAVVERLALFRGRAGGRRGVPRVLRASPCVSGGQLPVPSRYPAAAAATSANAPAITPSV